MALDMKEDFDRIIQEGVTLKDVSYFGKKIRELSTKYNVLERLLYTRFKSIYGKSPRDLIREAIQPSKEELDSLILNCEDTLELRARLGFSHKQFLGLYDRYYGVSTFSKAKEQLLLSAPPLIRPHVFREDNVAILMSQHLGDGYYDRNRHALKIQHEIKQLEYLRWKVGLIREGYPEVPTEITIHQHAQGHTMAS
jgi:hypothetical protein